MRLVVAASLLVAVAARTVVPPGAPARTDHAVNHVLKQLKDAEAANSTTHFYHDALLDHFESDVASPTRKWSQRYYVDESFWGGAGFPVFLYIGGEGPQGPMSSRMFIYAQAKEHRALLVTLEHRFYGESLPTANMDDANLRYLASAQALADLARFRVYVSSYSPDAPDAGSTPPLALKASPGMDSKWIAFGGSYPGDLAAWFKEKYPFLTAGVVASSAPVFAEYDFTQYSEVVGDALAYPLIGGSPSCADAVRRGVEDLVAALEAGAAPPKALEPCGSIASGVDRAQYYSSIFGNFQGVVQYNLEAGPPYVSDVCDAVDGAPSPIEALAAATSLFSSNGTACLSSDFEKDYVSVLRNATFDGVSADRQWIWQSCNEFGFFQTISPKSPFAAFGAYLNVTTAGRAVCAGGFGVDEYDGPRADAAGLVANAFYGGRTLQGINITAVNGNMDPWHSLGIVNDTDAYHAPSQRTSAGVHVVELDGTAHCRDMYAPGAFAPFVNDTASVVWAHATIAADIARYLS